MHRLSFVPLHLVLLLLGLFLSPSCVLAQTQATDPVLARVDGEEIRLSDLDLPPASRRNIAQTNESLRRAIRDRLLFAAASRAGTDQNELVRAELEKARRAILVKAFVSLQPGADVLPGDASVDAFIENNPDFFGGRRVYRMTEVIVDARGPKDIEEILAHVDNYDRRIDLQRRNAEQFIDWIKIKGFTFWRAASYQASEKIDPRFFSIVKDLENKGFNRLVDHETQQVRVLFSHGSTPEPVKASLVRDNIRSGLFTKANQERLERLVAELTSRAEVTIYDQTLGAAAEPSFSPYEFEPSREKPLGIIISATWIPFASLLALFLVIRLAQVSGRGAVGAQWNRRLAKFALWTFIVMAFLFVEMTSGWHLFQYRRDFWAALNLAMLASIMAGVLGGVFVSLLIYLLSLLKRPVLICVLALCLLATGQATWIAALLLGT